MLTKDLSSINLSSFSTANSQFRRSSRRALRGNLFPKIFCLQLWKPMEPKQRSEPARCSGEVSQQHRGRESSHRPEVKASPARFGLPATTPAAAALSPETDPPSSGRAYPTKWAADAAPPPADPRPLEQRSPSAPPHVHPTTSAAPPATCGPS